MGEASASIGSFEYLFHLAQHYLLGLSSSVGRCELRLVRLAIDCPAVRAALLIGFLGVEWYLGDKVTVPSHMFLNRNILAGTWFTFCNYGGMMALVYFLSIWFQAVKNSTAVHAGIMQLPLILGLVCSSIPSGILTKKIGYYTSFMILGSTITPIGMGLISTWQVNTSSARWIGYQFIAGFGTGLSMQSPALAAQIVLANKDVPIGTAIVMFAQPLGGTVFISVANNLFDSRLAKGLATISQDVDPAAIIASGASDLKSIVDPSFLPLVLQKYNDALRGPFYLATALAAATMLGSACMEWRSVKNTAVKLSPEKLPISPSESLNKV